MSTINLQDTRLLFKKWLFPYILATNNWNIKYKNYNSRKKIKYKLNKICIVSSCKELQNTDERNLKIYINGESIHVHD